MLQLTPPASNHAVPTTGRSTLDSPFERLMAALACFAVSALIAFAAMRWVAAAGTAKAKAKLGLGVGGW